MGFILHLFCDIFEVQFHDMAFHGCIVCFKSVIHFFSVCLVCICTHVSFFGINLELFVSRKICFFYNNDNLFIYIAPISFVLSASQVLKQEKILKENHL